MQGSKLQSRKFWMAIAGVITSLAVCLGNDVDPETTASIAAGLFGLYIIIEGVIDTVKKK